MRIIRTQLHGLIDYALIIALLLPWITNYATSQKDTEVFAAIGFFILTISMITDYEWGLIKLIPMRIHLFFDLLAGLLIMAMPFIFPLNDYSFYWPLLLGLSELIVTFLTATKPYQHKRQDVDITKPYH